MNPETIIGSINLILVAWEIKLTEKMSEKKLTACASG
jgi:hypothetical protein